MTTNNLAITQLSIDAGIKYESAQSAAGQIYNYAKRERAFRGTAQPTGYMASGSKDAEIMIVMGRPSESEQKLRIVGFNETAYILTLMFNKLGFEFKDCYWTLAVKDDTSPVNLKKIQSHRPMLFDEIVKFDPKVIISIGNISATSLMDKSTKIESPEWLEFDLHENLPSIPVLALPNFDTILEDETSFKEYFKEYWSYIKHALD